MKRGARTYDSRIPIHRASPSLGTNTQQTMCRMSKEMHRIGIRSDLWLMDWINLPRYTIVTACSSKMALEKSLLPTKHALVGRSKMTPSLLVLGLEIARVSTTLLHHRL